MYVQVTTPKRVALVPLDVINQGLPCQELFYRTDISGYEALGAEMDNNFDNQLARSGVDRYREKGAWIEIYHDMIADDARGIDDRGRLGVDYISHSGTEWEKTHGDLWAPKPGWCVPTNDGLIVPGTALPFETLEDRKEATARLEAKGIPKEFIMFFYRPPKHGSRRFVGREYYPVMGGSSRIRIDTHWLTNYPGDNSIGSRLTYLRDRDPSPVVVHRVELP